MDIRLLGRDDVDVLRTVRLRALAEAPSAFGSTLAREQAFTDGDWEGRLTWPGRATFVACDADGAPVGIVTGVPDPATPGTGDLYGLWVAPGARRSGVGDALVDRLLRWADDGDLGVVRLCVMEDNAAAERLYLRHGFVRTGCDVASGRDGVSEIGMERRGKVGR